MNESYQPTFIKYDPTSQFVKILQSLNIQIDSYYERMLTYHDWPYFEYNENTPVPYFNCSYKNWVFTICATIDEYSDGKALLRITKLHDMTNMKFYNVNLLIYNEDGKLPDTLLRILNEGIEIIFEEKYGQYKKIPDELRKRGMLVAEKQWTFNRIYLGENSLEIKLKPTDASIYLYLSDMYKYGSLDIEVSEYSSYGKHHWGKELAIYKFNHDINYAKFYDELVRCINCVSTHRSHTGYGFEENNILSTGSNLIEQIQKIKMTPNYKNKFINLHAQQDVNIFEGMEINIAICLTFKYLNEGKPKDGLYEAHSYSLTYDKKPDTKNCHLTITKNTTSNPAITMAHMIIPTEEDKSITPISAKNYVGKLSEMTNIIITQITAQMELNTVECGLEQLTRCFGPSCAEDDRWVRSKSFKPLPIFRRTNEKWTSK